MVMDGLRGYVQLASGLTDVTRERARAAARSLAAQGEAGFGALLPESVKSVQAQVATLADDLIATSRANRTLLVNLVRVEVDRSVARLGLVSASELEAATRHGARLETRVADLERELRHARSGSTATAAPSRRAAAPVTKEAAAQGTGPRRSAAPKAAQKSAAQKAAQKSAAQNAAQKSAAQKAAQKSAAQQPAAQKAAAQKPPARRSGPRKSADTKAM